MLSVVRTFVEAVCQARDVDRPTVQAVVLATSEAVTNIVRHAHRDQPERPFQIQCRVGLETVEITLVDQGVHFDLNHVPQLNPGELRVGGRGIFLMRALMDDIICETLPDRGNKLRLVKRRPRLGPIQNCG